MITRAVFNKLNELFSPAPCDSTVFIYNHLESQSCASLPLIYVPFDPRSADHVADRGQILDFALSVGGGRVLDFGPGDGWPSLLIAPRAEHVTGVDASLRRVQTCNSNAQRLGIGNAEFVHVPAGSALPFADGSFDGAVAASSIEQTPDPGFTLHELCRVLKPGGRLRMTYESLNSYRGGMEQAVSLLDAGGGSSIMLVYDRQVTSEAAEQYRLNLALSLDHLRAEFSRQGIRLENAWRSGPPPARQPQLTLEVLQALAPRVTDAAVCRTSHPTGQTFARLLRDAGFAEVMATHSGGAFAREMYDRLEPARRPAELAQVDELLAAPVQVVVGLPAPLADDPPLTAVKGGG